MFENLTPRNAHSTLVVMAVFDGGKVRLKALRAMPSSSRDLLETSSTLLIPTILQAEA